MTTNSPNASEATPSRRQGFWERLCKGGLIARLARAKRGNVAISFALAAIPIIVAAGTAIDLSRALIVRQKLIHALDAAGLAVGHTVGLTPAQMNTLANNFFAANYPNASLGSPSPVSVSVSGNDIVLNVSADLHTAMMGLVGINNLVINVNNKITKSTKGLELALVLDTTGSMADDSPTKISGLKSAANQLLDVLFGSSQYSDLLEISIVPFAASVRVDPTTAVNNGWIDVNGSGAFGKLNFSGSKYAYWMYTDAGGLGPGGLPNTQWTGCVEARPNRLDETDTPPSAGSPDTRWEPMFAPDEPHVNEAENSSWNPAAPNQSSLSSTFNNDYITNYIPISSIAKATAIFTSSSALTVVTGDGPVRFTIKSGGTAPKLTTSGNPALSGTTDFWIIKASSTTFKLATTRANAMAGTAAYTSFNAVGSGTMTMVKSWGSGTGTGTANGGTSAIDQAARQKEWQKYIGKAYTGTDGPLYGCGMQSILLPTNDKAALQNKINALSPAGNTHVPFGLEWGWQMVSGKLTGTGASAYSDDHYVKAIVVMTDGANTMTSVSNTLNASDYTAYGFAAQKRMGNTVDTASEMASEMDASFTRICNAIRAIKDADNEDRIRLYTIAFGTDVTQSQKDLLCNCAMDTDSDSQAGTTCHNKAYFYAPSGTDLTAAFQTIATDLTNLRVSH